MKTVNEDPHDFFKEGGWSFLSAQEDVSFFRLGRSCQRVADTLLRFLAALSRSLDRVNQKKDLNLKLIVMSSRRNPKKTLQSSVQMLQSLTLMLKLISRMKERIGQMRRKG